MDAVSMCLGFVAASILMPFVVLCLVSLRRMILDGSKIPHFTERVILVTGCDSGFGALLVQRLDSLGCQVIATCLTQEGVQRLGGRLSCRARVYQMDVTNEESITSVEMAVKDMVSSQGLWGLVNNAGVTSYHGYFAFENLDSMKRVVDVNLWGTVRIVKVFLPYLKKSKGRIVNMSSLTGRIPLHGLVAYSISKHAVEAFSDVLRLELSPWGISVHILEPGFYKTSLTDWSLNREKVTKLWNDLPVITRQEYGLDFFKKSVLSLTRVIDEISSDNPHEVIESIEHALLSSNPKIRYLVGRQAQLICWWISCLPADFTDPIARFVNQKLELYGEKLMAAPDH